MAKLEIIDDSTAEVKEETKKVEQDVHEFKPSNIVRCLQFPANVSAKNEHSSYLIFSALKVNSAGTHGSHLQTRTNIAANQVESLINIALSMPEHLQEKTSHNYSNSPTSVLADVGASLLSGSYGSGDQILNSLSNSAGVLKQRGVEYLTKSDSMTRLTGQRTLQNNTALYQGTALKEHTFRYMLVPKNEKELREIGAIYHAFLKYSCSTYANTGKVSDMTDEKLQQAHVDIPKSSGGSVVNVPPLWSVIERIKTRDKFRHVTPFFMFPCVITDVTLNKTPHQQYQTVSGSAGDPIAMELSITVKETIAHDATFYDKARYGFSVDK